MPLVLGYSSDEEDSNHGQVEGTASKHGLLSNLTAPKNRARGGGPKIVVLEKEKPEGRTPDNTRKDKEVDSNGNNSSLGSSSFINSLLPAPKRRADALDKSDKLQNSSSLLASKSTKTHVFGESAPLSKKMKTLGGGIKSQFDGEMMYSSKSSSFQSVANSDVNIETAPKKIKVIPAVVAARLAKYGNTSPKPKATKLKTLLATGNPTKLDHETEAGIQDGQNRNHKRPVEEKHLSGSEPELSLFSYSTKVEKVKPGPSLPAFEYSPIMLNDDTNISDHEINSAGLVQLSDQKDSELPAADETTGPLKQLADEMGIKAHEIDRAHSRGYKSGKTGIVDFRMDEFYQQNESLRNEGTFDDNQPKIYTIRGGRHQLESLVRSAQQNREGLEEQFRQGRKNKKESASKYGF